jgi:hypothetical protein
MSMREMHALCYERGLEFDPTMVPIELTEMAEGILATPAWEGRSELGELYERRAQERREAKQVPEWFSLQDLVTEPWDRERLRAV